MIFAEILFATESKLRHMLKTAYNGMVSTMHVIHGILKLTILSVGSSVVMKHVLRALGRRGEHLLLYVLK